MQRKFFRLLPFVWWGLSKTIPPLNEHLMKAPTKPWQSFLLQVFVLTCFVFCFPIASCNSAGESFIFVVQTTHALSVILMPLLNSFPRPCCFLVKWEGRTLTIKTQGKIVAILQNVFHWSTCQSPFHESAKLYAGTHTMDPGIHLPITKIQYSGNNWKKKPKIDPVLQKSEVSARHNFFQCSHKREIKER